MYFLVPETRKVALENMDTLFGGVDHVEKGANIMGVDDPQHGHHGMQDGKDHTGDEIREVEHAEAREVR